MLELRVVQRTLPWFIAVLVVIADRVTKLLITSHIDPQDVSSWIDVLPGFTLTNVHNTGIAFSLFADGGPITKVILHAVIGVAVVVIAGMLIKHESSRFLPALAFGLILGGAVGNLLDRVLYGWVIDFIHLWVRFGGKVYSWPDFNIADSAITIGACCIVLSELLSHRREEEHAPDTD